MYRDELDKIRSAVQSPEAVSISMICFQEGELPEFEA